MQDILEFVEKEKDENLVDQYRTIILNAYDQYVTPLMKMECEVSVSQRYFCAKHRIAIEESFNIGNYEFFFDKCNFYTNSEIEKSIINAGLLFYIYSYLEQPNKNSSNVVMVYDFPEYNKMEDKITNFMEIFNKIGIFGTIKIDWIEWNRMWDNFGSYYNGQPKFYYSNSPVINKAVQEINNDELTRIIQKFTNATAAVNQNEKVEAVKSISRMIDVDCRAFIKAKHINTIKHGNKDDIYNNSKINHPEQDNKDFLNKELDLIFDMGLSAMRYLESLKSNGSTYDDEIKF